MRHIKNVRETRPGDDVCDDIQQPINDDLCTGVHPEVVVVRVSVLPVYVRYVARCEALPVGSHVGAVRVQPGVYLDVGAVCRSHQLTERVEVRRRTSTLATCQISTTSVHTHTHTHTHDQSMQPTNGCGSTTCSIYCRPM